MPQSKMPYSTARGHQCLGSRQSQRPPNHTAHAPSLRPQRRVCISCCPPHASGQMCRSKGEQEHRVRRSRVDSVDSVDGTVTPLRVTLEILEEFFPADNASLVMDGRCTQRGYVCPVVAGWSHCSGWWTVCSPGCPRLAMRPHGQLVRDSLHTNMLVDGLSIHSHVVNETLFSITCACWYV